MYNIEEKRVVEMKFKFNDYFYILLFFQMECQYSEKFFTFKP